MTRKAINVCILLILIINIGIGLIGCGRTSQEILQKEKGGTTREITGYVYKTSSYEAAEKIAIANAQIFVEREIVTTETSGKFSLSTTSSSDETAITILKDDYFPVTIVTSNENINVNLLSDADKINDWVYFISLDVGISLQDKVFTWSAPKANSIASSGNSGVTISGKIKSLPAQTSEVYGFALNEVSSTILYDFTYDSSNESYVIRNVPSGSNIYVLLTCLTMEATGASILGTTYTRVDTNTANLGNVDLEFTRNSLIGSIKLPVGCLLNQVSASLYANNRNVFPLATAVIEPNKYSFSKLPNLLLGDSYSLHIYADKTSELKANYVDVSGVIKDIDLSSAQYPILVNPSPSHEAVLNGIIPTFSWSPVADAEIYMVVLLPIDIKDFMDLAYVQPWLGITRNTSISIPTGTVANAILRADQKYAWYVIAIDSDGLNINNFNFSPIMHDNQSYITTLSDARFFTF